MIKLGLLFDGVVGLRVRVSLVSICCRIHRRLSARTMTLRTHFESLCILPCKLSAATLNPGLQISLRDIVAQHDFT